MLALMFLVGGKGKIYVVATVVLFQSFVDGFVYLGYLE